MSIFTPAKRLSVTLPFKQCDNSIISEVFKGFYTISITDQINNQGDRKIKKMGMFHSPLKKNVFSSKEIFANRALNAGIKDDDISRYIYLDTELDTIRF